MKRMLSENGNERLGRKRGRKRRKKEAKKEVEGEMKMSFWTAKKERRRNQRR